MSHRLYDIKPIERISVYALSRRINATHTHEVNGTGREDHDPAIAVEPDMSGSEIQSNQEDRLFFSCVGRCIPKSCSCF